MGKLNIDALKSEYIGKTFNWLTILDVIRDGRVKFVCQCKCGNIKIAAYNRILRGTLKSCRCYMKSEEYRNSLRQVYIDHPEKRTNMSNAISRWHTDNPDIAKSTAKKRSLWYKTHPEEVAEIVNKRSEAYKNDPALSAKLSASLKRMYYKNPDKLDKLSKFKSDWAANNPDKVADIACKNSQNCLKKRINSDISELYNIIHDSYKQDLQAGILQNGDTILTKCPNCGQFDSHLLQNVFIFSTGKLKLGRAPLCRNCTLSISSSYYEKEISEFISTFYSEEPIRNNRSALNGKELDLYYPEKKIAIEFNGDYWHSDKFKDRDYHYNKFRQCLERNIILVSIFESEWNKHSTLIKNYLVDLFNGNDNGLSFNKKGFMNNNYPSIKCLNNIFGYLEYSYNTCKSVVYTCGYSKILEE
jgi:hypothetical protein